MMVVIILIVIMIIVIMLSVIMLSVIMLSVVMMSVVMLSFFGTTVIACNTKYFFRYGCLIIEGVSIFWLTWTAIAPLTKTLS
jgi:hypothetical protein